MIILYLLYVYLFSGLIMAIWFSFFKIKKIYPAAAVSSFWFRLIIMPASILLWPVVLHTLIRNKTGKK